MCDIAFNIGWVRLQEVISLIMSSVSRRHSSKCIGLKCLGVERANEPPESCLFVWSYNFQIKQDANKQAVRLGISLWQQSISSPRRLERNVTFWWISAVCRENIFQGYTCSWEVNVKKSRSGMITCSSYQGPAVQTHLINSLSFLGGWLFLFVIM